MELNFIIRRYIGLKRIYLLFLPLVLLLTGCMSSFDFSANQNSSQIEIGDATYSPINDKIIADFSNDKFYIGSNVTAYNKTFATVRPWNLDKISELFLDELSVKRELNNAFDARNYSIYDLRNGGLLVFKDGSLEYLANDKVDSIYPIYTRDEDECISPSLAYKQYPQKNISDFSVQDAEKTLNKYITALDIPTAGSPMIYTMDFEHATSYRIEMLKRLEGTGTDYSGYYPIWEKEYEAYRFVYQLAPDGYPLIMNDINNEEEELLFKGSVLTAIVSKNGVQHMVCKNVITIDNKDSTVIEMCSSEEAKNEVISNLDHMVIKDLTTVENLYFGYSLKFIDYFTFELVPVWHVGSSSQANSDIDNSSVPFFPVAVSHIVDKNGKEW